MPRGTKTLRGQTRKMVYDVHCFMEKEAKEGVRNVKQVNVRTAAATNISLATVKRIVKEANTSDLLTIFRTPGKKRSKIRPITGIDNFDKGVIKRCIHKFHVTNKELPTINKLLVKLRNDLDFRGSPTSLRRIIKDLGFRWRKAERNKVLIEKTNIRLKRIEYLQNVIKYRQEGRPIVYTDESYVHISVTNSKQDESTQGLKKFIGKRQRVIIIHAGYDNGFVPNTLLTFTSESKSSDIHDDIDYKVYEKWLQTQLIPNLPPNAVVILDNASYHNKEYETAPTSNSKLSELQSWLKQKGIPYSPEMLKPQLYKLIANNKEKYKKYSIDKILAEHNHAVLRLPADHPDLNPIEMAWTEIKDYVKNKNVNGNADHVIEFINDKINQIGPNEWRALCDQTKQIEDCYIESDHIIDKLTETKIVKLGNCSDSDSDDSASSSDQDDTLGSDKEEHDDDSDNDDTSEQDIQVDPKTHTNRKRATTNIESEGKNIKKARHDIYDITIDFDNLDKFGEQIAFLLKRCVPRQLCRELQDSIIKQIKTATKNDKVKWNVNVTANTPSSSTSEFSRINKRIKKKAKAEIPKDADCTDRVVDIHIDDTQAIRQKDTQLGTTSDQGFVSTIKTFHRPITVPIELVGSLDCVKQEPLDLGETSDGTAQEHNVDNDTNITAFDPLETDIKIEIIETDLIEQANQKTNSNE